MNWLRTIEEDRLVAMFEKLASELKEKELADNPRELTAEENNELGVSLTTKWQNENADGMEEKLVELYGTEKDKLDYANWKVKGE
jgi:hypothetical protein